MYAIYKIYTRIFKPTWYQSLARWNKYKYFNSFIYVGEAPCIGEGSEDRVGPQRVQDSARLGTLGAGGGEIHQKFSAGNKEFGKLMILMTTWKIYIWKSKKK